MRAMAVLAVIAGVAVMVLTVAADPFGTQTAAALIGAGLLVAGGLVIVTDNGGR